MLELGNKKAKLDLKYNSLDNEKYPQIFINYYYPLFDINDDIIIPFYCTDFYQLEYRNNDYSLNFKLRYEIDGVVNYKDIKAGDNEINFGKLTEGRHYYSIQIIDKYNRDSRRICDDIFVINKEEHKITDSQTYTITDADLINYNINKNNSEIVQDMINNRVGLTNLFLDLQQQGYRKCILPFGIYRINRTIRYGTGENTPIDIPTQFTVDMNGSTFKLHPYSDSEYGNIASVENLMVRMKGTFDSHIINGIFEGDYAERQENGWISGSNGEHSNCFYSYGAELCSLENITIKQITGYNICTGQDGNIGADKNLNRINEWYENINIVNGIEEESQGYLTSNLAKLGPNMISNKYIVGGVWLGYAGIKGTRWDLWFHFYDESDNFIETIHTYQYTRCRIPLNAKSVRCSLTCKKEELSNFGFDHMKETRYLKIKDCHWEDNRTCCAPSQAQLLVFDNCDFIRSGQSITPCCIDLEDGWERTQDVFIVNCGPLNVIDNSGINHQMINCSNVAYTARYRLVGFTIRDCKDVTSSLTSGYMTKNSVRIFNNEKIKISWGSTGLFEGCNDCQYIYRDNINVIGSFSGFMENPKQILKNNTIIGNWGGGCTIQDCTIKYDGASDYISSFLFANNCIYDITENATEFKFSFNEVDGIRVYKNCVYKCPCWFANHNYFNCGEWHNCHFEQAVRMNIIIQNQIGQILFNNCIFDGDVTITIKDNCYVKFNNCTFNGSINYSGPVTAHSNAIYTNEKINGAEFIKISSKMECLNINEVNEVKIRTVPYEYVKDPLVWKCEGIRCYIDRNKYIVTKETGNVKIIATTLNGVVSNELSLNMVDVDYANGKYINSSGTLVDYKAYKMNNRYNNVSGGSNIIVNTNCNVKVSSVMIVEYNEDIFIKTQARSATANSNKTNYSSTFNVSSDTTKIRVIFSCGVNEINLPLLFSSYTIN